jgi:hypothetical protein
MLISISFSMSTQKLSETYTLVRSWVVGEQGEHKMCHNVAVDDKTGTGVIATRPAMDS